MTPTEEVNALWRRYCELEARGDRVSKISALERFVERIERAEADYRSAWSIDFLTRKLDRGEDLSLRAPLFQRVLFPVLHASYVAGDARAARWLAALAKDLFRFRKGWQALDCPGEIDLWKEAYRRDPTAEDARRRVLDSTASFIRYTLHELPAGVLYGTDGANLQECALLLEELESFQASLRSDEVDTFHDLIQLATVHYDAYTKYLSQTEVKSYSAFLALQGAAQQAVEADSRASS